jgi:exonuclease SbcC
VSSLARFDPEYLMHLPHKLAPEGEAHVAIQVDETLGEGGDGEVVADGAVIRGSGRLLAEQARFYTERCYLAQATLGRLLEIYEHQDTRRSDSPLTRFVKEILGLDALDALIDGLHASGDVRRFREVSPQFWSARAEASNADEAVADAQTQSVAARSERDDAETRLRELAGAALDESEAISPEKLLRALQRCVAEHEERLGRLARIRRDLNAARAQVAAAADADAGGVRARAEATSAVARQALETWQAGPGNQLAALLFAIQTIFPDIPAATSDPAAAHDAATKLVEAARDRIRIVAEADEAASKFVAESEISIIQGQGRLDAIDRELAGAGGANGELAEALSAISAHIADEHCPVCGRDFSEMAAGPLAAHVSEEIGRLITAAGRVEALVRDRGTTLAAVVEAKRRQSDLVGNLLSPERRDALQVERAQQAEWLNGLRALAAEAVTGSRLIREATQSAQQIASLNSRASSIAGLRAELGSYAEQLSLELFADHVPLGEIIETVMAEINAQEAREISAKATQEEAIDMLGAVVSSTQLLSAAEQKLKQAISAQSELAIRRSEAERRIAIARDLMTRAQSVRSEQVRRIFNDELNSVWRELFIRLAPDEAFVPAFALPEVVGGPVEAILETHYRSGGKGGNPRAMLSAGNLNTAALTLFLALHLSVPPTLPWLIIDDPVQSMDDVHIAQFAALLRTLKQHGRQVILAVHDRQLFDYLTLELSPAFNGDRLITIKLGRNADGFTTAPWSLTTFEPDKAIAA